MSQSPQQLTNTSNLPIINGQVVIVYTSWNKDIIDALKEGCQQVLHTYAGQISTTFIEVPGCVEIPFIINQHAQKTKSPADAYIALGCVIKGDTPHFEYVCQSVSQGITILNTTLQAPVIFGILTVNNHQQALDRLGGTHGHKGAEAMITAIHMIHANLQLSQT